MVLMWEMIKCFLFLHEARVRFLHSLGYTELNLEGVGLIMADAALVFKNEIYYGDELLISIQPVEFSRVGFELIYKIEKKSVGTTDPRCPGKNSHGLF